MQRKRSPASLALTAANGQTLGRAPADARLHVPPTPSCRLECCRRVLEHGWNSAPQHWLKRQYDASSSPPVLRGLLAGRQHRRADKSRSALRHVLVARRSGQRKLYRLPQLPGRASGLVSCACAPKVDQRGQPNRPHSLLPHRRLKCRQRGAR